jgi:hypothetical protein
MSPYNPKNLSITLGRHGLDLRSWAGLQHDARRDIPCLFNLRMHLLLPFPVTIFYVSAHRLMIVSSYFSSSEKSWWTTIGTTSLRDPFRLQCPTSIDKIGYVCSSLYYLYHDVIRFEILTQRILTNLSELRCRWKRYEHPPAEEPPCAPQFERRLFWKSWHVYVLVWFLLR